MFLCFSDGVFNHGWEPGANDKRQGIRARALPELEPMMKSEFNRRGATDAEKTNTSENFLGACEGWFFAVFGGMSGSGLDG